MQKLTYNRNKQVIVTNFTGHQRWLCPNCLNYVRDDFCKEGYTVTCIRCKKEFEVIKIRVQDKI